MIKFPHYCGTLETDGNAVTLPGRKGRHVRCVVKAGRNGFVRGEVITMPLKDFQAINTMTTGERVALAPVAKPVAAPKAAPKARATKTRKTPLPAPTGDLKPAAPSKLAGKADAKAKEAATLPTVDMTNIR